MSFATFTANGLTSTITEAEVSLPSWGIWSARVDLADGSQVLSGACVLTLGSLQLKGTIRDNRGGIYAQAGAYLVFGGADGWCKSIDRASYRGRLTKLSTVAADAARLVGESVVLESNAERQVGPFARVLGPASRVLNLLSPGAWWIEIDGTTHIGTRKQTPAPTVQQLNYEPDLHKLSISEDEAIVLPGQVITVDALTGIVSSVTHTIKNSKFASELWLQ